VRCRVCNGPPVIEIRQHNAAFCEEHFLRFCRNQVERTISKFEMFSENARILVAVSGGKDSLALWDLLVELGYAADGLVIGLGIGAYSSRSTEHARAFAEQRGLVLHEYDLEAEHGFTVPSATNVTKRVPCSACGLSKRHIFDAVAIREKYDAVVTGHNLDDEAAVLFGNVARWNTEYLARQYPVLPERNGFPRKAKPLVRLTERDMAAYCVLRNIDYIVEECPMAEGNKHLEYKELLNNLEVASPGAKHNFYFGFLDRAAELFRRDEQAMGDMLTRCIRCGSASSNDVCSFCRLAEHAVSVEIGQRPERLVE